jgi:hypothetical protein
MPLPTLDKTYQFNVNQAFTASGTVLTDAQKVILAWVSSMLNFASNPWTVVGSANGTGTYNMAGTNTWTAPASLVWSGSGNHSWIVLKSSAIGAPGGIQLCIALNSNVSWNITVAVSPSAGFTGGTATTRPTATDETLLASANAWKGSSSTNGVLHVMQSTDGQVLNMVYFEAMAAQCSFHVSVPKNPISGWAKPSVYWFITSGVYSMSTHYNNANARGVINGQTSFYLTGEGYAGTLIESGQNYADDNTSEWPFGPIGLFSLSPLNRGRKGQLYDLWWGATSNVSADNYPADGSRQYVQFVHMIWPWNGSQPLIS